MLEGNCRLSFAMWAVFPITQSMPMRFKHSPHNDSNRCIICAPQKRYQNPDI